jgi:hypothetical protein
MACRLHGALLGAGLLLAGVVPGCDGETAGVLGLCNPGDEIFCRCKGGAPGTKACKEDGETFGECLPCDERETTGPAGQTSSGAASSSSTGAGGGTPGDKPLFAQCQGDADCESAMCRQSYCTQGCDQVSDCPYPQSECVSFAGENACMATCQTAVDCLPYGAPPSLCGFTKAVDNWDVTVCAGWGDQHLLMPVGTDCVPFDHEACNLGYSNREIVCSQIGLCTQGCFTNDDCSPNISCSSQGALGTCG